MPHLYQQPSQHQHQGQPGAGGHGVPPQTGAANAQAQAQTLPPPPAHMLPPPSHALVGPQITPPHPYSAPYGAMVAGVLPPGHPQQPSPHAAAAIYQAGFASAQHQHHVAAAQMQIQAAQAQAQAQAHQMQQAQMQRAAQMQAMYGSGNSGSNKQHVLPYRPSPSAATAASQNRHQQAAAGAGSVTVSPGTSKRENSDGNSSSAEDIAVSALSMLCGAALGDTAKPAEAKTEEATATTGTKEQEQSKGEKSEGVPVEGSPSFEETNKTTMTDPTTEQKTTDAAHISPASTVATVGSSGATPQAGTSIKQEDGHAHTGTGTAAASSAPTATAAAKPVPHFPSLLHDVLTNSRHAGSVLEWLPHGQGWRVLRWDEMARTVLPEHFPQFCTSGTVTATATSTTTGNPAVVEKNEVDGAASKSEHDGSEDTTSKAKVTPKAEDTDATSTSTYADVNAFLAYVRAWGFQEVRDAGPDMGSYRHAVSLLYIFIWLGHISYSSHAVPYAFLISSWLTDTYYLSPSYLHLLFQQIHYEITCSSSFEATPT